MHLNHIIQERGFLFQESPATQLPPHLEALDNIATHFTAQIATQEMASCLTQIPTITQETIDELSLNQQVRVKLILTMIAQAFVWEPVYHGASSPRTTIPSMLSKPLMLISKQLDEPPIFNYADYVLRNWKLKDPSRGFDIDNIDSIVTFSGTQDEANFVIVHVAYEAVAGRAYALGLSILKAVKENNKHLVVEGLNTLGKILPQMRETFLNVGQIVSPENFRNQIRLFLKGWRNNVPLEFEGFGDMSHLRGETGSQSSVIPFFDTLTACFSDEVAEIAIAQGHQADFVNTCISEYRDFSHYMPAEHRQFLKKIADEGGLRAFILANIDDKALVESYNHCLEGIVNMRGAHLSTVGPYINKQHNDQGQTAPDQQASYGTGGTDYRSYLGTLIALVNAAKF